MNPLPDTFHNPYLWPLLLFALLPTVLYLVDRRRARRLDWPALRFFLTRQRARLRWIRLREALLILVRSLALFLVVYALLGPATRVERELSSSSSLSRGLVLVFDTSFSMSYSPAEEAGDLLKRAKARARTLLDELRPADSALVVSPPAIDRAPGDDLFDLEKTRLELEDLELGGGPFDLLHAIDDAIGKAALLSADIREIYIFTDHQAGSLPAKEERSLEFLASRLAALDPAPSITLVDCGVPETSNHRIVEFKSDSLVTGTDATIGFHARVAPAPGAGGLHLRVTVNGEVIASRPLEEEGPATRELSFSHRFSSAGTARVSAELVGEGAGDGLPGDAARHLG
ncbi:MAG: BatA domain-containing protein, partial [Planctomycetes bacterium]|nr:BatA domain-containing protein [Planctomycetota bacterium]